MTKQDKELLQNLIKREEKTLFNFYRKFNLAIFHFLFRQLNDKHLAEEVTQDVFLDFIESLRDFRGQCSLKTYLFTIARNKVIDVIRKKKLKKILFSALPSHIVEGLKTIFLDEEIEKKELEEKIKKVFQALPNEYRLVLRLKYIEGEKVKSIAQRLSLGFKATESLIFRARKAFIKVFQNLP